MKRSLSAFVLPALLLLVGCSEPRQQPHARTDDTHIEAVVRALIAREPHLITDAQESAFRARAEVEQRSQEERMRPFAKEIMGNADGTFPAFGNDLPAATIVEAMDYNCGYCKQFHSQTVKPLLDKGVRLRVRILWSPILGPGSRRMIELAAAAQLQGKFVGAHEFLIMRSAADKAAADQLIPDLVRAAGLDRGAFLKALDDGSAAALVAKHEDMTRKMEVRGTPALWVADKFVPGAVPAAELEKLLGNPGTE